LLFHFWGKTGQVKPVYLSWLFSLVKVHYIPFFLHIFSLYLPHGPDGGQLKKKVEIQK